MSSAAAGNQSTPSSAASNCVGAAPRQSWQPAGHVPILPGVRLGEDGEIVTSDMPVSPGGRARGEMQFGSLELCEREAFAVPDPIPGRPLMHAYAASGTAAVVVCESVTRRGQA